MNSIVRRWFWLPLIILVLMACGCVPEPPQESETFNERFESLVEPYTFNYTTWEIKTLWHEIKPKRASYEQSDKLESSIVASFFSVNPEKQDQSRKEEVENILARQISQVLAGEGIFNPFLGFHFTFPPVNFKLEKPPDVLIVSPRDRIERIREVILNQDMIPSQIEELESELTQLKVSALVIPIGGLGVTYPTFVMENSDLKYTIVTVTEEWLHQYLAFRPLGFRYVLDLLSIKPDADMPSLNETVAGVISEEIGDLVYSRFYWRYPQEPDSSGKPAFFDFNTAMRETRLTVDSLLAQGKIDEAERYMEDRRQFINSHGYNIRKLNQAYFAFYGAYAYSPTSVDPLGDQVKALRQRSPGLKDFLEKASRLTSREQLEEILMN